MKSFYSLTQQIAPPDPLICLPQRLVHARSGRVVERIGPNQEVTRLPGIAFFDAWRVEPNMNIPGDLPSARNRPEEGNVPPPASPRTDQAKAREEEARDILAGAIKNQAEDGPSTRKAAIRAYRYLHAMVWQHGPMIQQAYNAAKEHAVRSKGPYTKEANVADPAGHQPLPRELPTIPPELTSELLHCLSTLPDPWPPCKTYHQHGKCQPMGLQNGETVFC